MGGVELEGEEGEDQAARRTAARRTTTGRADCTIPSLPRAPQDPTARDAHTAPLAMCESRLQYEDVRMAK